MQFAENSKLLPNCAKATKYNTLTRSVTDTTKYSQDATAEHQKATALFKTHGFLYQKAVP